MWEVEVSYAARLRIPNHNFAQPLPFLTVLKQNVGSWGFYANHDGIQTYTLKTYCFLGYQKSWAKLKLFYVAKEGITKHSGINKLNFPQFPWDLSGRNSTPTYDAVLNVTGESMTNNWLYFLLVANKTSISHQLFKIIEAGRGCGKAWCVILMSGAYANFNFPKGRLRLGSAGAVRSCDLLCFFSTWHKNLNFPQFC